MKRIALVLIILLAVLPMAAAAQDYVRHTTSDGGLTVMVPAGWTIQDYAQEFPLVAMTNRPDLLAAAEFPETWEPDVFLIGIFLMDDDALALELPEVDVSVPFEQKAEQAIMTQIEQSADGSFSATVEDFGFETLAGQNVAIARAKIGDLAMLYTAHQLGDALVLSTIIGAPDSYDALRDLLQEVVLTAEAPVSAAGNNFTIEGDPLLAATVTNAAWVSDFSSVVLGTPALHMFKIQLRDASNANGLLEISGLPVDIEPGTYDVGTGGTMNAFFSRYETDDEESELFEYFLTGSLTIEEAQGSVSGVFDLQAVSTDFDPLEPTTLTGTFTDVTIPDVSACVIYSSMWDDASSASIQVSGGGLIEVDAPDAGWIVQPGEPADVTGTPTIVLFVSSVEGNGPGSYVTFVEILRESGETDENFGFYEGGMTIFLFEVVETDNGEIDGTLSLLAGTVFVSSGNELSGEFDLEAFEKEGARISGEFSDIPIPAQSCAETSD